MKKLSLTVNIGVLRDEDRILFRCKGGGGEIYIKLNYGHNFFSSHNAKRSMQCNI